MERKRGDYFDFLEALVSKVHNQTLQLHESINSPFAEASLNWFSVTFSIIIHDYYHQFFPKLFLDMLFLAVIFLFFSTLDLNRIYKFILYTQALDYTLSFMVLYSLK